MLPRETAMEAATLKNLDVSELREVEDPVYRM